MSIRIDPEFESLIPPLTADEFKQLEENCVAEGIRDPLVVWSTGKPGDDDILVDGHNRWKISAHHGGILFTTKRIMFRDRDEVKQWIIQNQLGRRNITPFVRAELALKLKPLIQKKAKGQQIRKSVSQKSVEQKPIDTQKELAKAAGVSHDTIHKVEVIQKKASPEAIKDLKSGKTSINKVYSDIRASELQTRRQEEGQKLREAQKRHEEYINKPNEKEIDFSKAKQDKEDGELIFAQFTDEIRKMDRQINGIASMIERGTFKDKLRQGNKAKSREFMYMFREWMNISIKALKQTEEVVNEK